MTIEIEFCFSLFRAMHNKISFFTSVIKENQEKRKPITSSKLFLM